VLPVDTNIIIFSIDNRFTVDEFLSKLKDKGVVAFGFGPQTIRFVTHMGFSDEKLARACEILSAIA
jgi:threonine aldolase